MLGCMLVSSPCCGDERGDHRHDQRSYRRAQAAVGFDADAIVVLGDRVADGTPSGILRIGWTSIAPTRKVWRRSSS
ncbi:MAG: hypothetical protein ACLSVD_11905 [Eggerthellaceae bacterium]